MKAAAHTEGVPVSPASSSEDMQAQSASFDQSMRELEALIEQMESGRLPLEESLSAYGRGVALLKRCRDKLAVVTQQVQVLEADLLTAYVPPPAEEAGEAGRAQGSPAATRRTTGGGA
ncbi:MAG: exodeoxyribonuclease VII small subunit [Lautropia sp.]|nr:exodeoxyribonuclease VII small subunit [Lautropia sp.]